MTSKMVHDDPRSIWKGSEEQKTRKVGQEGAVIAVNEVSLYCLKPMAKLGLASPL